MGQKSSKKKGKSSRRRGEEGVIPTPKPQVQEEKAAVDRKWILLLAVIGVITLVSYLNCFNNKFVFDDIPLILENRTIRGIEKIPRLLGIGKKRVSYRPIRMVSYAVDYTLNKKLWKDIGKYEGRNDGLNPLGYHISNLLYHIITSFLVFLVVYRLVASYRVAFLAASLFALHPVHTDSVTYLSGRRDILFSMFYLSGFYLFLRYRQTPNPWFIIASFLAYLLSIGSKEMGVTLPAVFLCYDLVKDFKGKGRKIDLTYFRELLLSLKRVVVRAKYLYSLAFLGALTFSYYKIFIKSPSHQISYYGDSMFTTFFTLGKILVYYIRLLVFPITLNADYSYNALPLSSSFFEPATFFSFIFLLVVGYVLLRLLAYHKMIAFGGIWFFVTLLPVCQIFPHHELLAEHYLYLPSFGICLLLAVVLERFLKGGRYRYGIYLSFVAVLFLFSLRIVDRNRDWRDELTLWKKTIDTVPQCARAHSNLGAAYEGRDMLDKAIAECKRALIIDPNYSMAHNNLGTAYEKKGRLDEAISEYKQALNIKPRYAKAHYNLGVAYFKWGKLDEAIAEYRQALTIKPRYAEAHNNLGITYVKKGKLYKAISEYKKALAVKPRYADAHYNLGVAYARNGKLNEAISEYKQTLIVKPGYADAYNSLGTAYVKKGRLDKAIEEYKQAISLKPRYADAHYNLGIAYVKKGRLDEAVEEYEQVLALEPQNVEAHTNLGAVYQEKGRLNEAISQYKKALVFNPNYAGAHNNLAIAYFEEKQYALAVKHCDRAIGLGFRVNPKLLKDLLPYR